MGSSSFSSSKSEESISPDRSNYQTHYESDADNSKTNIQADQASTTEVKTLPHDEKSSESSFESSSTRGSWTTSNGRNLAATQKTMKGSSRRPLREIGAPNRSLRSNPKAGKAGTPTVPYTSVTGEVAEYNFGPAASLEKLMDKFLMAPKMITTIESILDQSYYHEKTYIAVSSPGPDGSHRAKVGRLGMTSHLQRAAAYKRCGLHIVTTVGVASSQRVEKLVVGLLKANFKWKEAGDTDVAPYFQQMTAMGRKIPCPCGRGHDDVFLTSSASHEYLEDLLMWARDRDRADLSSAEFISNPIERFEPSGLHETIQHRQRDITPPSASHRRVTRLQKRQVEELLQNRANRRRIGSGRSEQWVRDKAARLVRSPARRKK
ncbi:hypothetical protein BGX38DRAFT_1203711 [Terfezia claveryi]|nr:hypothetical protein BGX38DRAFT_1203711 [Terfezia claveryi]